jgi:hypothetical protein
MIHPGRFVSLELSVVTQFFRKTNRPRCRHADRNNDQLLRLNNPQRTAATDEYEVLLSAALLRKLLLDQERLMDQVNRRYRLDLRFRISGVSPFEQQIWDSTPIFWALEDVLDPESPLAYAPFDATRDQFLGRRAMRFSESWITIRDVIDQLANIEGAVHRGNPKESGIEHSRRPKNYIAVMAYLEW